MFYAIQFNQKNYKQTDVRNDCFFISNIFGKHIVRVENEVVKPTNPPFYKRFVDDVNK